MKYGCISDLCITAEGKKIVGIQQHMLRDVFHKLLVKNHEDGSQLHNQIPELMTDFEKMDRIETWEWRFFSQQYEPVLHMAGYSPSSLMAELYEMNPSKNTPAITDNT